MPPEPPGRMATPDCVLWVVAWKIESDSVAHLPPPIMGETNGNSSAGRVTPSITGIFPESVTEVTLTQNKVLNVQKFGPRDGN